MEKYFFIGGNLSILLTILFSHFHHKRHLRHIDKVHKDIANQMMDISLMMEKVKRDFV